MKVCEMRMSMSISMSMCERVMEREEHRGIKIYKTTDCAKKIKRNPRPIIFFVFLVPNFIFCEFCLLFLIF